MFAAVFGLATGCSDPTASTVTISGTVVDFATGRGVADVTVSFGETATKSDADGLFEITVEPSSTPSDLVVSGATRAHTRVIDVLAVQSMEIVVPNRPVFGVDWATATPDVSVTSISPGETIGGIESIAVSCASTVGVRDYYVYLHILSDGVTSVAPSFAVVSERVVDPDGVVGASHDIDTTWFPNGVGGLGIVAFDMNDNCTVRTIPITVDNTVDDATPPGSVGWMQLRTYTTDGVVVSSVEWLPVADADGYAVYRRTGGAGAYALLGRVVDAESLVDREYVGEPGVEVAYKVVAYNSAGEGVGLERTIVSLPAFSVTLEEPADRSADVSCTPTFRWRVSADGPMPEGAYSYGYLVVWDMDGVVVLQVELDAEEFTNGTYEANVTLSPGAIYTWNLLSCNFMGDFEGDVNGNGLALSYVEEVAVGAFLFSTVPPAVDG